MRRLPTELPEIYTKFLQDHLVVKRRNRFFDAVTVDVNLGQIIQSSHKSTGGIIGQTRQSEYVTKWEIVYHEIHSISNALTQITNTNIGSRENEIYHELEKRFCSMFNFQGKRLLNLY